ncbi:YdaS family helix-turn-helix protein [Hahella ganghwensis]|uniref:YdaS family helix-turn-helix protein n=1 Tax=Hahella ganghwensis TaxID=286420 RepID=UPI000368F5C4|nr:YdaS family helix-turn-helix protein [Hahella ganghwensis]
MDPKSYYESLPRGQRKQLASELEISPVYLCMIISGDRPITAERAVALEDISNGQVTMEEAAPDFPWSRMYEVLKRREVTPL